MDCYFCKKNIQEVDHKDTQILRRYLSGLGKIRSKEKTSLCATHQRKVAKAVKVARHIGLLSHISKD
ncbi:MAG: 30S ribosomal protein S18 [Candidatus Wildermuthbacteria bacterium]|nr:30S ribosomal protein S18 [Candidatus Wildermuthbacteria bacterium]